MTKAIIWTPDDKEQLIKLFTDRELTTNDIAIILNKTVLQCRRQARRLGIKKTLLDIWPPKDDELLTYLWCKSEIATKDFIIQGKSKQEILRRVGRLKLVRNPRVKQLEQIRRNKLGARELSDDTLLEISKKYKTFSQFKLEDNYAYTVARIRGLFKTYDHLTVGITFNYPQTALFEIIKELFCEYEILYNDRKIIWPKELDVYIPELKIGFEYDGKNFHDVETDKIKDAICKNSNIKLFRVIEMSKSNPMPDILLQLNNFGFDVSKIEVSKIKTSITKYYMDIEDIKEIISRYDNVTKFRNNHSAVYNFLKKNDMLNLVDCITPNEITEDDIIGYINLCQNKNEFYTKYYGIYLKIMKNDEKYLDAYKIYNILPDLQTPRSIKPKKPPKTDRISIEMVCPHCNKSGKGNVMFVWHFDNCKSKVLTVHTE